MPDELVKPKIAEVLPSEEASPYSQPVFFVDYTIDSMKKVIAPITQYYFRNALGYGMRDIPEPEKLREISTLVRSAISRDDIERLPLPASIAHSFR